jgi:tetratricopeptide (TPR) repeat protein
MKKCSNIIGIVLLLLLYHFASCNSKTQVPEPEVAEQSRNVEGPSHELSVIDSMMWKQPDSALSMLQEFVVSPEAEALDTFDGHYCQLLISELLYKNDCEQTNREDLLQAVSYFDSLVCQTPPSKGGGGIKKDLDLNPNLPFLSARAHYINGVGYYENDSVVSACEEYLKALEMMEEHFEEQKLVGKKAQFMTYIYNRLGDMFEKQLLAEPAITCYKQALFYCRREPTSIYGIPVLLYNLGIQYDVDNQKDSAAFYYDEALENMPDFENLHYRDLMANKTIFAYYNMHYSSDSVIKNLKHLVALSADEEEKTTRILTLGNILFEDKQYDSSLVYLETIFEQREDNNTSKLMAAENLSNIYQMKGDSIKAQKYASFLVGFTMSEIEKKTDASKLNEMFKDYLSKKQAEKTRKKALKRALEVFIPIVVAVALLIFIVAKHRSKKLLKEQQEEADKVLGETEQQYIEELRRRQAEAEKTLEDKEKHHQQELEAKEAQARKELEERDKQHAKVLEAERQTHRMEQAAISGRLKRSNQEVRELKDQIKQWDDLAAKTEVAASFEEESICRLIMDRVNEGQFKSKIDYIIYKDAALDKQQLLDLRLAADRHFGQFTVRLKKAYPELTNSDLDYCCLYLLGLTDADIAALMQRTYNTVFERNGKIRKIFGSENPLPITLMGMAKDSSFI